ncbi:hypothetical protein BH24ACT12_BH24ACT12_15520 [soil metagenome]
MSAALSVVTRRAGSRARRGIRRCVAFAAGARCRLARAMGRCRDRWLRRIGSAAGSASTGWRPQWSVPPRSAWWSRRFVGVSRRWVAQDAAAGRVAESWLRQVSGLDDDCDAPVARKRGRRGPGDPAAAPLTAWVTRLHGVGSSTDALPRVPAQVPSSAESWSTSRRLRTVWSRLQGRPYQRDLQWYAAPGNDRVVSRTRQPTRAGVQRHRDVSRPDRQQQRRAGLPRPWTPGEQSVRADDLGDTTGVYPCIRTR